MSDAGFEQEDAAVTPDAPGGRTSERPSESADSAEASSAKRRGKGLKRPKSSPIKVYREVREQVARMLELDQARQGIGVPSAYAAEELASIEYMMRAPAPVITRLREHCHHLTGVGPHEYRAEELEATRAITTRLKALRRAGKQRLLVTEPELLGGFGVWIGGGLHNADSLDAYECLIAMARGGVLAEPGDSAERAIVWEIGGGWGGLAYRLKTLFPNTTYVISDFPQRFLFSATYLMTAFPSASVAFHGDGEVDWAEHDFVFVPCSALEEIRPPTLGLTISVRSFEEMTTEQVEAHVARAYELSCPYLYSFGRDRAPSNIELQSASETTARYFWPHEVDMTISEDPSAAAGRDRTLPRRHIVGWRRRRKA